jgi:hypothetical protein
MVIFTYNLKTNKMKTFKVIATTMLSNKSTLTELYYVQGSSPSDAMEKLNEFDSELSIIEGQTSEINIEIKDEVVYVGKPLIFNNN